MARVSFTITNSKGEKERIFVWGKTDKEADEKLQRAKIEYEMGLLTVNSKTTVTKWADEWFTVYRSSTASEQTIKDYKSIFKSVFGSLDNVRLSDIKPIHIQNCLNQMTDVSDGRINKAYNLIRACMLKAVENGLIARSPTVGIVKPKGVDKGNRRALSEQERKIFRGVINKQLAYKHLMFAIMYGCGLRPGEVRALEWRYIDLKQNKLTVQQAVKHHSQRIGAPKSSAGRRIVPIPLWLSALLQPHQSTGLVFPDRYGKPHTEQYMQRNWVVFLRLMDIEAGAKLYRNEVIEHSPDLGQDLTAYNLRHTYATELAENGVDIKTAQYLLGHSDIKMTAEIYTHITNKMLESAREKIDKQERESAESVQNIVRFPAI